MMKAVKRHLTSNFSDALSKQAFAISLFSFLVSFMFSLFIILRLQVLSSNWIKYANVVMYFLNYHIVPVAVLTWFLSPLFSKKQTTRIRQICFTLLFFASVVSCYLLFVFVSAIEVLPEYVSFPMLVISIVLVRIGCHKSEKKISRKKFVPLLALILSMSILLPHIATFTCYNTVILQATSLDNPSERAIHVSDTIRVTTTFSFPLFDFFRSRKDFWKFLLIGVGACGEVATATANVLEDLGFETRTVSFPGEDHAFVEVRIDDKWMVLDPGYYYSEILTREQRAERRIAEFGAISYVIGYVNTSFVELTQQYVPTDIIIIKVTYYGEPLANAQIHLTHKFMNRSLRLPDSVSKFHSDGNGTITIHLGALTYNEKAKQYDSCYWIYVNDKNTGRNVTSTGSGKTHLIEIDLSE